MTGRASYDSGPDLAALLRVLQWSRPLGCPYPGSAADLHARLLSLATGGLLAPGACEEACDWLGGDNGDALKGDRTVRVGPRP